MSKSLGNARRIAIALGLVLVAAVATLAVVYRQVAEPYLSQVRAARSLGQAGADVQLHPVDAGWVGGLIGEDNCVRVVGISVRRKTDVDALLAGAADCRHLKRVQLLETDVSDDGLAVLADKTTLESLEILGSGRVRSRITDAGVARLAGLYKLERLAITDADVTDESLEVLAGLTEIRNLSLHRTRIAGHQLHQLTALKRLKWLHLNGTPLEDDCLTALEKLTALEHLSLTNSAITDRAVDHLAKLRFLARLSIGGTGIGQAGRWQLENRLKGVVIDF